MILHNVAAQANSLLCARRGVCLYTLLGVLGVSLCTDGDTVYLYCSCQYGDQHICQVIMGCTHSASTGTINGLL